MLFCHLMHVSMVSYWFWIQQRVEMFRFVDRLFDI